MTELKSDFIQERPSSIHLMIDLETMGSNPRSPIVAIGVVPFHLGGPPCSEREFYCNVNLQSSLDIGLKPDGDTIMWWLTQSKEAASRLTNPMPKLIHTALGELWDYVNWFRCMYGTVYVWGNGSSFDISILDSAYDALGEEVPWHHSNVRDVRTIVMLCPEVKSDAVFVGTKHNALDDCKHQIDYLQEIYRRVIVLSSRSEPIKIH